MALVLCVQHNERVDQFLILKLPPADNYRVQWSLTRSTGTCSHWEFSTVQGGKIKTLLTYVQICNRVMIFAEI